MKRIYSMKSGVMDKVKEFLDYADRKLLIANSGVMGAIGGIFDWIANNPQTAVYFFFFGGVTLVASVLKTIREHKAALAEEKRKEELHQLELRKIEQELNQDQDKHKKDLDKL